MAITTWAATTGDWDDAKFSRAWDGPNISPAVGSLSLSTTAPSVNIEYFVSVGNASLEIIQSYEWNQFSEAWEDVIGDWSSGPVPHVAIGDADAPAKADLTLTGSAAPTVGIFYNFPITVGELTATGSIPAIKEALQIVPAVGSLEIIQSYEWNQMAVAWDDVIGDWESGTLPHVAVGSTISPDEADLTLTGSSAPSLIFYIEEIPAKADLTVTGSIPVWNFGKEFDVGKGDLTSSTSIPDAVEAGQNQPGKADLTLTGVAPDFTKQQLWYVPTQDLTLSTVAPDAPIGPIFEPATAPDLTIVQTYDWENYGGTWANAVTTWNEDVFAPRAEETQHELPANADLTLTGQVPISKEDMRISPAKGDLTLAGQIPVASENQSISPAKGDLAFASSGIPRLIYYYKLTPENADLTTTTSIPYAVEDSVGLVGPAHLTINGYAPHMGQTHFRTVGAGSLTGLGTTSWDDTSGDWASASGTWGTGTLTPIPGITYTFPIDSGDEFVLTTDDPGWPLVRQPYYKPQVIMS